MAASSSAKSPIEYAMSGDLEYFKSVDINVIKNARDENGSSVLSLATVNGNLSCVKEIHRRCPDLLYLRGQNNGTTAWHNAAGNGFDKITEFLITASAKVELERGGEEKVHEDFLFMTTEDNKRTALHCAVEKGHLQSAKLLIKADASNKLLRMGNVFNETALDYAVYKHFPEIVKLLLEADPDFEHTSDSGITPLCAAWVEALSNDDPIKAEIRKLFIEKQPRQCRVPTGLKEYTLIHHATRKGDLKTIQEIIHFWPDCCELVDKDGNNFLHLAIKLQHANVVNYVMELTNIADNVLNGKDNDGETPLHVATSRANQSIVLSLLSNPRVNKMVENMEGKNALNMASTELLEMMIEKKYPIECASKGDMDFFSEIQVDVLLNSTNEDGDSVLSTAVKKGHLDCCALIFTRCPELLYKTNKDGVSALHVAASSGENEIIKFLLSAQDITGQQGTQGTIDHKLMMMVTNNQQTALHFAVERGHFQSTELLIMLDPFHKLLGMIDHNKETAMHYAVKKHYLDIVKLLLQTDPDFEYSLNNAGNTPLSISLQEAFLGDHITVEVRNLLILKQSNQCKVRTGGYRWTLLQNATAEGDLNAIREIIQYCPDCMELVDNEGRNFLHLATKFQYENVVNYVLGLTNLSYNVLNGQDNNGDTPLHLATEKGSVSIALPLLYDVRVKKSIQNNQGKSALDVIRFDYDKRKAGVIGLVDLVDEKELKERSDFDLLVGALISTVSFTSGIMVPGGYISDGPNKGTTILQKKGTFVAFVTFNTLALALSLFSVFIHFCMKHLVDKKEIIFQLKVATVCSIGAILSMMVAFIMGSLEVLSTSLVLMFIVCLICSIFFVFSFYFLWRMRRQQRRRRHTL